MAVKRVRVKVNPGAVRDLLKSEEVQSELERRGRAIEGALPTASGEEWDTVASLAGDRASFLIRTGNAQAREAEAVDRALTRAIDSGRG